MSVAFHAPLGALFAVMLASGPALAGAAVVSTDMTGRAGPGDNFKPVWTAVAGSRVDVFECDMHQWCLVEYEGIDGWVRVKGVDPKVKHATASEAVGDGSEVADAEASSPKSGDGGGRSRPTRKGGSGFVADDGAGESAASESVLAGATAPNTGSDRRSASSPKAGDY